MSKGATTDFMMDAVGVLPGLGALDNWYDRKTKSKTGFMQGARKMLSIVVPSLLSGKHIQKKIGDLPSEMPKIHKKLIGMGAFTASEV